jgi:hypothetical protein
MAEFLMPLRSVFEAVAEWPNSIALRESQYAWAWVLVFHLVSMSIFAGLVVMMDLRLLGVGNMKTPFSQVQRRLFPWQMLGMTLSAITGIVLVFADPMKFYGNIIFWTKMLTMALAGVNAMAFHFIAYETVTEWDTMPVPPLGARLAGALGIALWANVIVAGRLIPYNWFQ